MGCNKSVPEKVIKKPSPVEEIEASDQPEGRRIRKNIFGAIQANSILEYYEIFSTLGSSLIGTLFYARHIQSQGFRTLREINKLTLNEDAILISQEVSILKELDHPNVLKIYEAIETPRSIYIALEHIQGTTLLEKVKNTGCETLLSRVMLDVFSALNYLHVKGIAHCNICPENIIQTNGDGHESITKLIGFTVAQRLNDRQEFPLSKIRYQYGSPELYRGEFDERTDIWSCGVLMYDLLTGRVPFPGKTKSSIIEAILKGNIDFENSMFTSLTFPTQDLIKSLLTVDTTKRPKAHLCLMHPMLNASKGRISISIDALNSLRTFKVHSVAARSMLLLMNARLGKEDHEIVNYFKELDENFDGRVSKDELVEAFERLGIDLGEEADEIMMNMDMGGNGFIDYSELKISLTNWNQELKEKNLAKVFNVTDSKVSVDSLRFDLIDIKQFEWLRFMKECPNDGYFVTLSDLKNYLKKNLA